MRGVRGKVKMLERGRNKAAVGSKGSRLRGAANGVSGKGGRKWRHRGYTKKCKMRGKYQKIGKRGVEGKGR